MTLQQVMQIILMSLEPNSSLFLFVVYDGLRMIKVTIRAIDI